MCGQGDRAAIGPRARAGRVLIDPRERKGGQYQAWGELRLRHPGRDQGGRKEEEASARSPTVGTLANGSEEVRSSTRGMAPGLGRRQVPVTVER